MAGQGSELERTLASLHQNTYRKTEVLVVGYGISHSEASTQRKAVQTWGRRYYHCLEDMRAAALAKALRRHTHGELLLVIDGGTLVHAEAISNAVRYFQNRPHTTVLLPHVSTRPSYRLGGVFSWYAEALRISGNKADAVYNTLLEEQGQMVLHRSGVGSSTDAHVAYDPSVMLEAPAVSVLRLAFQEYQRYVQRWCVLGRMWRGRRPRTRIWLGARCVLFAGNTLAMLCVPFAVAYGIYLAIGLVQPLPLLIAIGSFSVVYVCAVFETPCRSWRQRCLAVLGIPLMYGAAVLSSLCGYAFIVMAPLLLFRNRRVVRSIVLGWQ
jgi:hypothetical protein